MLSRAHCLILLALLFVVATPSALRANDKNDRVQVGHSIVVEEGEEAGDLVCIGCSIRMMGTCGDIVAVGGSISIEGTVKGDAVTVGGGLSRHPNAVVKGDVTSRSGPAIFLGLLLVPLLPVILVVALIIWLVKPNRPRAPVRV